MEDKNKIKGLSKVQMRAYQKLDNTWKSSFDLGERLDTLRALYRKGLVERLSTLGSMFSPQTRILFRKKESSLSKKNRSTKSGRKRIDFRNAK